MATVSSRDEVSAEVVANLDYDRLQGTWDFFAGPRAAQMLIAGDQFTVRFRNGEVYLGTFTLGPTGRPKSMDMQIVEGPDRHRGLISLAIYALDGERLIWSTGKPGASERPRFFPGREDREPLCIVFQRQKQHRAINAPHMIHKPR